MNKNKIGSTFRGYLRSAVDSGVGVTAIARKAGVSETAIRYYLNGERVPSLDTALNIANAIGVNLGVMVGQTVGTNHEIHDCYLSVGAVLGD